MNFFKKIALIFLSSLVFLNSMITPLVVSAQDEDQQSNWYSQNFNDWYGKVYDDENPSEIFGERYTAAQVQWIIYSLISFVIDGATGNSTESQKAVRCFLINTNDINECLDLFSTLLTSSNPEYFVALSNQPKKSLLSAIFADRPLSGISYVKNKLTNLRIIPEANAQATGFGFDALKPVQDMWRSVRDIAFGLFVLATIIMAFMIMFRVKISPQLTISVQSALPKIISSLILVTFSYAIAGFLIDLMYVVIGVISLAFSSIMGAETTSIFNILTTGQPTDANVNFGFVFLGLFYIIAFAISLVILLAVNLGALGVALTGLGISLLSGITAGLGPLILIVVAIIAILMIIWHFIKITWELVKSFAMVLLLTITAPLQIVAGIVIPSLGFGAWIKSFVSSLSTFVVVGVLTLFSYIFLLQGWAIGFGNINLDSIFQVFLGTTVSGLAAPNLGSASWPPLLGMGNSNYGVGLLFVLVSFVLFTLIPKAETLVQSFITGKPMTYGTSVGELTGPLGAAALLYGANKIEGGTLPWPLNQVPAANKWVKDLGENKRSLAEQIRSLLRK